jgi:hypothetical protein
MSKDTIYRQAAIDALNAYEDVVDTASQVFTILGCKEAITNLPSVQPEHAIPLQWIEAHIEWLKSLYNAYSTLTAVQISVMVNKWKDGQDG